MPWLREAGRPFDLSRGTAGGRLLRCSLLRLAERDHVALVTMHHIVGDGWSLGILVREVTALYLAFADGRPSPLPELPVQYADFALWQRSWLQGEVLEGEIAYWRRQLAGLPALLELPTDRPRPAVQSFRGAARPVRLPAELTRQAKPSAGAKGPPSSWCCSPVSSPSCRATAVRKISRWVRRSPAATGWRSRT